MTITEADLILLGRKGGINLTAREAGGQLVLQIVDDTTAARLMMSEEDKQNGDA